LQRKGQILRLMIDKRNSKIDRVLVVEDEADISSSLAYALRAGGYEVLVADRGKLAMEALSSFHPDLVLLDLMLPDMSGIEICRHLRKSTSLNQPAVIILSARALEIDRVVGFKIEVKDYHLDAVSEGREALGRVKIVAVSPEGTFTGIGTSTDIVEASAKAYMDVVNKICRMRKYAPKLRGKRAKAML